MKKLLLMVAAVAVAASLHAASASWQVTNIYKVGSTSTSTTADRVAADTYYGYLITITESVTVAKVTDELSKAGSTAGIVSYLEGIKTASSATTAAGKIQKDVTLSLADGSYNMFTVILDSTNGDPSTATNYLIGDTVATTVTSVGNSMIGTFNARTMTQTASNWTAASVPEPTSGLLLLLGVASLALKRKQA